MWNWLILGYLTAVAMAFVGAARLPRVRWLLLVLGTLGILVPAVAVIAMVASLNETSFG